MPRTTRKSSMNRCRPPAGWPNTHPMYSGAIATIQNFTPPRLTMSSVRSLGETRSSPVIRISPPALTGLHIQPEIKMRLRPLLGERLEQNHAADEEIQGVHIAAQREDGKPAEEHESPARVQDEFTRGRHGRDFLLSAVDEDRVDERRGDGRGHREPADRERKGAEVPHQVRKEASGNGEDGTEQEEGGTDADPIRHPPEDDRRNPRGEREEGEQQSEFEGGAREQERSEGRGCGDKPVDPALARERKSGPPAHTLQIQREDQGLFGLGEPSDEKEIGHDGQAREAKNESVTRAIRDPTAHNRGEDSRNRKRSGDPREAARPVRVIRFAYDERVQGEPEEWDIQAEANGAKDHPPEGGQKGKGQVTQDHDREAGHHGSRGLDRTSAGNP